MTIQQAEDQYKREVNYCYTKYAQDCKKKIKNR